MAPTVLIYDREAGRGTARLTKNLAALEQGLAGHLQFLPVERPRRFGDQPGAEDLLLSDDCQVVGVVVHELAPDADRVLEAAQFYCELRGLPADRVIVMSPNGGRQGLSHIGAHAGNGYLAPKDLPDAYSTLRKLL